MTITDRLNRANGYALGAMPGMTNADVPTCPLLPKLPIWDEDAVKARLSAALYRHFGAYNTADAIRAALGRESARTCKAWLMRDQTPPLAVYTRLYHTAGLGDPFHRAVMGLPEQPDMTRAIALIEKIKGELLREGT